MFIIFALFTFFTFSKMVDFNERIIQFQNFLESRYQIVKDEEEIYEIFQIIQKVQSEDFITLDEEEIYEEFQEYVCDFKTHIESQKRLRETQMTRPDYPNIFCTPLYKFLHERRSKKGEVMTHYGMPGPLMGRYFVKQQDESRLRNLYHEETILRNTHLNLGECHKEFGPVVIDLDFKYDANTELTEGRIYSKIFIETLISKYYSVVLEYFETDHVIDSNICFVSQKPSPKRCSTGSYKDGLHIQFPNIITIPDVQKLIRKNLLRDSELQRVFKDLNTTNSFDDVFDEAVIEKNGWMLYGSRKFTKDNQGRFSISGDPYVVHSESSATNLCGVFEAATECINIHKSTNPIYLNENNATNLLSIRNSKLGDLLQLSVEGNDAYLSFKKQTEERAIQRHHSNQNIYKDGLSYVVGLVKLLSIERARTYSSWIQIGWCLFNIDCRLLPTWTEFSQQVEAYQDSAEENCKTEWENMSSSKGKKSGIGTLTMFAKEDSPVKFKDYMKNSAWYKIKNCCDNYCIIVKEQDKKEPNEYVLKLKKRSFDDICYYIVEMIKQYYGHIFLCTSYEKKNWMIFKNHRWNCSDRGVDLCPIIDEELYAIFSFWSIEFLNEWKAITVEPGNSEMEMLQFRKHSFFIACQDFALFTRNPKKKRTLIDLCSEKMFWTKCINMTSQHRQFEELLDDNSNLIGLNNGIFDLSTNSFKSGKPEDFISLTTRNNYVEYDWNHPIIKNILLFLKQVFPNDNIRKYACKLLASFLDGHLVEKFYIWTGVGGNGKSKLIELFQLATGNYCGTLPVTLITGKRQSSSGATPELARMKGKRLGIMNESNHNDSIDLGLIKSTTGGDMMYARALHKDPIEFRPTFQMILLCNKKPKRIDSTDMGAWRRITILRFTSRFVDSPNPLNENEYQKDTFLDDKLKIWKQGFFWILTQYYVELKEEGNPEPEEVVKETEEYRESNDIVGQFMRESLEVTHDGYVTLTQLFKSFLNFQLTENNEKSKMLQTEFEEHLTYKLGDFTAPNRIKGWSGYRFKTLAPVFNH